jgi:hypothetical protein
MRRLDVVRVRVPGDHVSLSGAANRRPWRTPATSDAKEAGEAVLRKQRDRPAENRDGGTSPHIRF